jgi:hypothetical protein
LLSTGVPEGLEVMNNIKTLFEADEKGMKA